ncbi:MAG: tetratricopeptide repeat protein, partial [Deltaproteobacteria bacterium]|nr:tetratricopeptide repeat protein [Deltaproteobacteria bacterium]
MGDSAGLATRVLSLVRQPGVAACLGLSALAGIALTRLPLFEVPGYELGEAMALLVAVAGGVAGIAAGRRERERVPASLGSAVASALLACLGTLALPFLAAVLGAVVSTRCSPWTGAAFFALLPVPSALLAAATGVFLGALFKRALFAALTYTGILLVSLAGSLWPVWDGPQVFALNHFLGYFPGPLYDEALEVETRLLVFRGLTLAWAGIVLLVGLAAAFPGTARLQRRLHFSPAGLAALLALIAVVAAGRLFDFELGMHTRAADLDRSLGGRLETAHFVLHYPRAKPLEDVRRLERDLEFKYDRVAAFLGEAPTEKIHAWIHASPEEKHRHVGAAQTSFAKPWRLQFHVHDEAFPHPVLRHEMAHAVAAAFGPWPLRVSSRWGLLVHIGLVEGLAVAADERADDLTLHQWAAAMQRLSLAPDVRTILGPAGFYRQAASRAYTLAGSFLRFLEGRHGAQRLRQVYRDGDFEAAYGKPLDALAAEWEAFLAAVPLDAQALHAAQVRFERPSIFERPCAREVAALLDEAMEARQTDPGHALGLLRRCAEIEPGNSLWLKAQAEIRVRQRQWRQARQAWQEILAREAQPAGVRAAALMGLGDAHWALGDQDEARKAFQAALALHRDRATDRMASVKLEALADPVASPVLRRFFLSSAELPEVLAVQELAQAQPANATARYLVGRQLLQRGDPLAAERYLSEALGLGLADAEVRREGQRLLVQARYLSGDCSGARE